jgi:hypothetical protein
MTETKPKRRWFRFSLRTLFVLVTIACTGAGWVAYQLNWIRERHDFVERYQCRHTFHNIEIPDPKIPFSLRLLGEKPVLGLTVRKDRMERAKRLFPEAFVNEDTHPDAL